MFLFFNIQCRGVTVDESWRLFLAHAVKTSADIIFQAMEIFALSALSCAVFNASAASPLTLFTLVHLFNHGSGWQLCVCFCYVHEIWQLTRTNHGPFNFGIFYICLSEMKYSNDKPVPRIEPLSKLDSRKQLMKRRSESVESSYDVFLGGSCNPTTWRTDTAIPKLKEFGISYYNPQVAQWVPELIERENQAKESAKVMFFVIDNQTRSVACMIEAAHVAGTERKLMLILNDPAEPGSLVLGEPISEKEHKDLKQGREYLKDIVEMREIPVFQDIHKALVETKRVVKENIPPQRLETRKTGISVPQRPLAGKCLKYKGAFDNNSSRNGEIQITDLKLEFKALTGRELPQECLEAIASRAQGAVTNGSKVDIDNLRISFDQFCVILCDLKHQNKNGSVLNNFLQSVASSLRGLFFPERPGVLNGVLPLDCAHIYLGGALKSSTWREEIAIPALKKQGLTHFYPLPSPWNERFTPLEMHRIENSKVLLFVITKTERCLSEMLVAAHYVGRGCNVVLCIQNLEDGIVIDGEQLTELAIKDYNRGRMYLSDLATRSGVPVYDDISEAVAAAAEKCKKCHTCT
ncbi:uncharacterized protein LOC135368971 isoform X2 [Ornithodoros turicata]|uniref:uncharacterized protein LOC135368971 isoform X2 n=1 Tax=Ornithodoros turicata TaxID=34597 RepID=UPI003139C754